MALFERRERLRRPLRCWPDEGMPLATRRSWRTAPTATVTSARRLNRAAGVIAVSVLIDSAMEHYRRKFHNKAMWTLVTSSLSIAVCRLWAGTDGLLSGVAKDSCRSIAQPVRAR
ncbi:hypothetical protein [Mesorhizobium sp. ES1-4]|uniref:hypothetical protein n=1 Tax=Mesorhizobium sp. ES1-4 TaxID=2876627 RepID=UPI001CCCA593|nr:hypothetical protein [Mesorhizobium sp. ES1-4]MBZ9799471.1 hypothetical protein [Mesorhizobium sp. ES1-4]